MDIIDPAVPGDTSLAAQSPVRVPPGIIRWLTHDAPFIAMLLLALTGVIFRLQLSFWFFLIPIFAMITIAAGWHHVTTRQARLELILKTTGTWAAILLSLYLLYADALRGVLNANAISLTMMILLALGTFVGGILASVWRVSAVGAVLFLAVPGLGWLDQSPLLLTAAAVGAIALGGLAWWVSDQQTT